MWPPHQQLRRHEAARLCAQRAARKAVGRQSEVRKHRCPRLPSCPRHGVAPQASVASAKGNGTELTLCLSLFSSSCKSASFILAFRSNPCHEGPMAESGLNRRAGGAERQRVVHTGELGGDTPGGHPWALRLGGQDAAGHPGWGSGRAWAGESLGGVSRARHGQGAVQKRREGGHPPSRHLSYGGHSAPDWGRCGEKALPHDPQPSKPQGPDPSSGPIWRPLSPHQG